MRGHVCVCFNRHSTQQRNIYFRRPPSSMHTFCHDVDMAKTMSPPTDGKGPPVKTLLCQISISSRERGERLPQEPCWRPPGPVSTSSQLPSLCTTQVSCRWLCLPMTSFHLAGAPIFKLRP